MAHPFGGHPSLAKYLEFARENGFTVRSGYCTDSSGKAHTVTKVFKEGGPSVIVSGLGQDEFLVPTQVGNLDRRLGLNSPFFSVDDSDTGN